MTEQKLRKVIREILVEKKNKGLWHNIHAKRKRGEKPAKKGDKDYPKTLDIEAKLKEAPKEVHHSMAKNLQIYKGHIKKASKLLLKNFKPRGGRNQVDIDTKSNKYSGYIGVFVDKQIFFNP